MVCLYSILVWYIDQFFRTVIVSIYIKKWLFLMFRYAKEKEPISTSNWQFGHGRVSNASIETYFRTIKMSVLENKTTHRPYDFLIRNRNHIYARFKGDSFDVAQSSRNRKKASDKTNDLTVKDEWRRRPLSKTKQNKRSVYFNDEVTETAACKLT